MSPSFELFAYSQDNAASITQDQTPQEAYRQALTDIGLVQLLK